MSSFVAIDFETADHKRDSACAVALVKVRDGHIVDKDYRLIRPPRKRFFFTHLHGISWDDVKGEADFGEVWGEIATLIDASDLLLAHNAPFDRGVLGQCCTAHGIVPPENQFVCTVKLARTLWDIRPTTLPDVCRHLKIGLQHHHAESDALACAQIGLSALRSGHDLSIAISNGRRKRKPGNASPASKKPGVRTARPKSDHVGSTGQIANSHHPDGAEVFNLRSPLSSEFRLASDSSGNISQSPLTQDGKRLGAGKRPIVGLLKAHMLTLLWGVILVLGLILAVQ